MSSTDHNSHPYSALTPEVLLTALESIGLRPDGSLLALNSYENRVYQVGMDEEPPLVAKFYRPQRWSDESILEEHQFTLDLADAEIPVIAPQISADGATLHHYHGFSFALFPRRGGRWPELEDPDNLEWIGRFMGRIHQLGSELPFDHRPSVSPETLGGESIEFLLSSGSIPIEQAKPYQEITRKLMETINQAFKQAENCHWIRLHGDCHPGNILWTDNGPHFVDMDDCRMGPAIQDLWMLLSGEPNEMALQLSYLREGYETFRPLDPRELILIEPLRTLRMIHYAAWLARRWNDPAFPAAFTWFNTPQYWQDHLATLEQQQVAMERPALPLY
ncbi:MAG: serine/threonine protein kinase [Gammaproteobacteria bacterium]|nr:serine/threonine protein kinase [Gammaproteobacteria bacterium]